MKNKLLVILSILTLCSTAMAQIEVSTEKCKVLSVAAEPEIVAGYVVLDAESKPTPMLVSKVSVGNAEGSSVTLIMFDSNGKLVKTAKAESLTWLVLTNQKCNGFFIVTKWADQDQYNVPIELDGLDPVPDDDDDDDPDTPIPSPDNIPADKFDNIGQRVGEWATGLDKRIEYAMAYEAAALRLKLSPDETSDSVAAKLVTQLQAMSNYSKYLPVGRKIMEDFDKRWPMDRRTIAEYYEAIAIGFRGGKNE